MIYINPIEILKLNGKEVHEIDSSAIKKSKRRLFADIDLSDNGFYNYYGQELTKSECEHSLEELDDKDRIEYYLHLSTNSELNEYLANGNDSLLNHLKQESIYKMPEFIDFISPYFSYRINNTLLNAFKSKDIDLFTLALKKEYLISKNDINQAYKRLDNEIQQRIAETDKLTNEIKEGKSQYTDENIYDVIQVIKDRFPIELLNILPVYFQSQTNKIAAAINYLQMGIWNELSITAIPLSLLEYLLELEIESVTKPIFEKNYSLVKKKHNERIEQEKNAPLLKEWAKILISIQDKIKDIENEIITAADAFLYVKSNLNLTELNKLPSFANEIRIQIGFSLRSMSVASWNNQTDIKNALALINYALEITVEEEIKSQFQQAKNELQELEYEHKGILVCHFCETNTPVVGCEIHTTIYKVTKRDFSRVEFSYLNVKIPRCRSCEAIHNDKSNNIRLFLLLLSFFSGLIVAGAIKVQYTLLGGIIGAAIGFSSGLLIKRKSDQNHVIKDSSKLTLSTHPLLIMRMIEGWTFIKPSA